MDRQRTYDAIIFRQRQDSPLQVSFAAPSSEVDSWARVPTKRTGDVRNFQRAEIGKHVKEVAAFFQVPTNSSPTAIVVGFDPIRAKGRVRTLVQGRPVTENDITPGLPTLGTLELSWQADTDPQTRDQYVATIVANGAHLKPFIYEELKDITGLSETALQALEKLAIASVLGGIQPKIVDTPQSVEDLVEPLEESSVDSLEESEVLLPEIEIPEEMRVLLPGLSPSEQQVVVSRLFFLALFADEPLIDRSIEFLKDLHDEVQDELKPGILIDGQHRVVGTKMLGNIPFLVTALPNAPWPELAFQFIVTNRTAKKVPESLLISIVGNSLSKKQRGEIEERLREAGIRVGLIEAVMRIQEDPVSPFYRWLAFGLKNEDGFLDAAAMRNKVIQMWYERLPPVMQLFDHICKGKGRGEKTEYWKADELWLKMFVAFWAAVKERYEGSSVFSSERSFNAKNKKREPVSKLMTATVLKVFQTTILTHIHEFLRDKHNTEGTAISESLPDEKTFSGMVTKSLARLTPDFFVGWDVTGFDGSSGTREDLADAIRKVIRAEKTVAQLKGGKKPHRLFQGEG